MNVLTESEVKSLTDLVQPKAQARKLRELGYIVIGFSAKGRVRALAEHPAEAKIRPSETVRLNL